MDVDIRVTFLNCARLGLEIITFGFDSCHYWYQMNCEKQANSILAVRIRAETGNIDSPHLGVFQGSSLKTMRTSGECGEGLLCPSDFHRGHCPIPVF